MHVDSGHFEQLIRVGNEGDFLRALLENIEDGVVACDADGVLRFFNRATYELHGLPQEPLSPEKWAEHYNLFHADGKTLMRMEDVPLYRALHDGSVTGAEMVVVPHEGRPRHIVASGRAVFDNTGKKIGAVVSMHEVTDRYEATAERELRVREQEARSRAEALADAVRESEQRFRNVADHSPVMMWVTGPDARCTYLNQVWYDFTGQTDATGLGFGRLDAVHPDDAKRAGEIFRAANEGREPFRLEYRLRHKNGDYRWCIDAAAPRFAAGGEFLGYVGSVIDITERQQAEAALRESEEWLRLIMANVKDHAIFTLDLAGKVTAWNIGAERVFGYAPDDILGRDASLLFTPEDRAAGRPRFEMELAANSGFADDERNHVRNDGSQFSATGSMEGLRDEAGRLHGFVKVVRDITEQNRLEERREQLLESERAARTEAERVNRIKDEFLATLSHELRTPLNAILGWSELLKRRDRDTDFVARGIDAIERNARSQTQLIEDLLDMSRIISGKVRLDVQQVDLAATIDAAVAAVQPAAQVKEVRVRRILDPLAGPVSGDPNRLQQVIWNLLTNAVKFTPKGGQVHVLLERVNSHLEVSVIDTGRGIKPEFLPFVFERFHQADASTTREHGGLGLGLAIVKHLIELHGGSVRVKSPGEGRGATFVVTLPLVAVRQDADEEREHPTTGRPESVDYGMPRLDGATILVVDDHEDARDIIERILSESGATILTAASGAEGLEVLFKERPTLLVSDVGMPEMDGYEFIRKVRSLPTEKGGNTPAVALTAFARSEDRRRALIAGYQMHLAKPVEPAELLTVCASLVSRTS